MLKKSLFYCITFVLLFLVACGTDQSSQDSNKQAGESDSSNKVEVQGVTDDEIIVGQIGPQSGHYAVYDLIRQGVYSYFRYVNDNGGVNGRKLKLISYDDKFEPKLTVQHAKRLEETDKIFALVGNVGTVNTMAIEPYLNERNLPLIGVNSGSKELFNPAKPNIFGNQLSYTIEVDILTDYLIKEKGVKTLFISYLDTAAGVETLDGVDSALKRHPDVEVVGKEPHLPTDTDFSAAAQKIKNANPDAVIVGSGPSTTANLKKELYKIGVKDVIFAVSSVGGDDPNLYNLAGEDVWTGTISDTSLLVSEVSDDPQVDIFVEEFKKDFPDSPASGFPMWGWAMAQIFVEAVERAGDELTRDNLKKQLETFDNWEGSLLPYVTYTPENHYGNTTIYITEARDGTIVPITEPITYDVEKQEIIYR